ncbi:hypothetical protein OROHE_003373 [Orobanche hederae]
MSRRGTNRSKRGRVAFVHSICPSGGRGRHVGSDTSGHSSGHSAEHTGAMNEDVSSSPGNGSSSADVLESGEPSERVFLESNIVEGKPAISISLTGQFIHGAHRDPARWFGELFNGYTFEEFFPTPKSLSKEVFDILYSQFRIQIEKAFKKLIGKRYSGKVFEMKDKWLKDGLPLANCLPNVWEKWEAHWGSKKFKRNSEIAKANRNSKEGQGSVHTGGSINFSETWDHAKKKYGDKAAAAAVFMATHTTKGPDGSIKWINPYYQDLFEEYEKRAREEAVEEGSIEPESTERPEFREKLWKTIFLDDKQPKGDRLPGFGPHGAGFFNLPLSSQVTQCFASSSDRSQNVDQETFDDRVQKEVQRQLEIERQEREAANRQLESKIEERIQQEREIAERGFEERLQQFMVQMMQQQPTSGNGSTSSVSQYINLNGGLGCNSQSGGGGRCDSSRGGGRGRRGGHGRGH